MDPAKSTTIECILQEVMTVGRRLKGMDSNISALTAETKSIGMDIAGFQNRVTGLEQRITAVENHLKGIPERDHELLFLHSKVIDLQDRSRRDSVRFFGFLENSEGSDTKGFLRNTIPVITGLTFDPPLEFQWAHRLGPKQQDSPIWPHPINACFLRH
ncbi:hypothetical protein NDU88_001018 [Pleurodeles waltl]|uniref:Uncharacterized protein n=1 Tax=Pleurodeles waltl TaxID=8319 RepID=A0AAV7THG3_PLEWA|nr:hypothetical protein NDU88_001018 [Pleurodeles waltl]